MFTIFVGGAREGDVLVRIESASRTVEARSLTRTTWGQGVDHGDIKLVVRRAVGRRAYRLLELDARRMN
jgi:hypothetical protein